MQRRQLLGLSPAPQVRRPPWAVSDFEQHCLNCRLCIEHCPEQILYLDPQQKAALDFSQRGCTLCGRCVELCPHQALQASQPAFDWLAEISTACLTQSQIACRSCEDYCEVQALRFQPRLKQVAQPVLDPSLCTGCGQCLAPCPTQALSLIPRRSS